MKPLDVAPIFLNPRVRLRYQVPLSETLELVRTCKDDEKCYPAIEDSVDSLIEGSSRVFTRDVFDLTILKLGLEARQYIITVRGKYVLRRRLNTMYADGMEFKATVVFLMGVKIEPTVRLRPRLMGLEELALEAATMSRGIGVEVDIELGAMDK